MKRRCCKRRSVRETLRHVYGALEPAPRTARSVELEMLAVLRGQSSARPHRNTAWCSTTVLQVCHLGDGHEHHEFEGAEAARSRCSSREYVQPLVSRRTGNNQVWCRYPAGTRTRSHIIQPNQVWQVSQCLAACSRSGGHVCRSALPAAVGTARHTPPSLSCPYILSQQLRQLGLNMFQMSVVNAVRKNRWAGSLGWDRGDQGTVRGCGGARARVYTDSA